ncbi:MAG TPA: AAA family ATPase [Vicinamibacterales bacterium]|nr:AAA family ATPase [Vicinamibacterales bacterium]
MYESFFGLRERPFDLTPNPKYVVMTESHREVLLNLEYGIASRKGITLLIGEAGSGKTTMIRTAIDRLPGRVHIVNLHNPTLSKSEFNEMLATNFGLSREAMASKAAMLTELERLLLARNAAGERTVLIVDEAQSLPLELLEEIRLLANIETNEEKLLSVIIAGQPELAHRLNDRALRQFKQRVALRCELRPLTSQETAAYVVGRIRAANGIASEVFTRQAVQLMHERAGGIPRTISVIADNALLGGYAAGQRPVGMEIVAEICRDFDFGGQKPAARVLPGAQVAPRPAIPPTAKPSADKPAGGNTEKGLFSAFSSRRKLFSTFWS